MGKQQNTVTFACVMRSGGWCEMQDVFFLHQGLKRQMGDRSWRLICLTDQVTETRIIKGVLCLPLEYNWPGWWSKMELFRPGLESLRPFMVLDLDTAIVGPIADMYDKACEVGFVMLRDFYYPRPASGLLLISRASSSLLPSQVWDRFAVSPTSFIARYSGGGDQEFLAQAIDGSPDGYWQDLFPDNRVRTFKPKSQDGVHTWYLQKIPEGTSIVCFHGLPRPREVAHKYAWTREYWGIEYHPDYPFRHDGVLAVLGSAEGGLKELGRVLKKHPDAGIMAIGHAAGMTEVDFVVTDHYEVHPELRRLQSKFHSDFTTHCSRASGWRDCKAVDYWWDWPRATATSAETAIRIGLAVGFDEIILCGCPLRREKIQHPDQVKKDGKQWPPPRDIDKHGYEQGKNTSDEICGDYQREFARKGAQWAGQVTSMGGFTRRVLGAPSWHKPEPSIEKQVVSILCPTRGRPELAQRMVDSALGTAQDGVEIWLYVDPDEPDMSGYGHIHGAEVWHGDVSRGVGAAWNILARASSGSVMMMGNDDLVFHTAGWDRKIKEALHSCSNVSKENTNSPHAQPLRLVWVDDGSGRASSCCAFPIIPRRWMDIVGYFTPECFHFLWHDTYVHDVAKRADLCQYIPDVLIEHCHFSFGKAEKDETYERHRQGPENARKRKEDKATFGRTRLLRQADADLLKVYNEGV